MRILITGSEGFIGKNLRASLAQRPDLELLCFDLQDDPARLPQLLEEADFVYHLAGVNRPPQPEEFQSGNAGFTASICSRLSGKVKKTPLLLSSSTQAELDNPYGLSKRQAEHTVFSYGRQSGAPVYVYRLSNVFGKWCRPNYNSAVATFCHNTANALPLTCGDPATMLRLVYIDDVVASFVAALEREVPAEQGFCRVEPIYSVTLAQIVELLRSFSNCRESCSVPDLSDPFTKKLYSTYLSYLPERSFKYPLRMNVDARGSFTEFIKTRDRGQLSVNIIRPGVVKGNHWHHTKTEKFVVVSGEGAVSFRRLGSSEVLSYEVSGARLEVVEVPAGYTHNIANTGATDLILLIWCNEIFDPQAPDTYPEAVMPGGSGRCPA